MTGLRVAIVGAGFGGLIAARRLKAQGFEPTVFESHDDLGGQWNFSNPNSGVWPRMRTNTAAFATRSSDMRYRDGCHIFPRNTEVLNMINDYVGAHDLRRHCRFRSAVVMLQRVSEGYEVAWNDDGGTRSETFDRAVVATGRFIKPEMPVVDGMDGFEGSAGVVHSFEYKDPLKFRDLNIVVLGGSISSLEMACDQALMGTGRIVLSQRRQRYVMPKMFAGTPLEYLAFTLEGARAMASTPQQELLRQTKEFLEIQGGNPAQYDAPAPHEDMARAGVTGNQHYLNLVAEDYIDVRPWVRQVQGNEVVFEDGSRVEADAILVGTGFDLYVPFLSPEIARTVNLTKKSMDLANFTFHPDLPGLAFVGLWSQLGPYPSVLEQQARWIAYAWGGVVPAPTSEELRRGVAECVAEQHHADYRQQHEMALRFARLTGAEPDPGDDEELRAILPHCAVTGEMLRISGPDSDPDAIDWVKRDFWLHAPLLLRREIGARLGLDQGGRKVVRAASPH